MKLVHQLIIEDSHLTVKDPPWRHQATYLWRRGLKGSAGMVSAGAVHHTAFLSHICRCHVGLSAARAETLIRPSCAEQSH